MLIVPRFYHILRRSGAKIVAASGQVKNCTKICLRRFALRFLPVPRGGAYSALPTGGEGAQSLPTSRGPSGGAYSAPPDPLLVGRGAVLPHHHLGSLQRSPDPLLVGRGAVPPQGPHHAMALWASALHVLSLGKYAAG